MQNYLGADDATQVTGSRGPKSKANAVRRNAPKATKHLEATHVDAPELPAGYVKQAVAWWDAVVTGPVAQEGLYTAADWQIALRGALLVNLLYGEGAKAPTTLAAEIGRIEDRLGLSLAARDRLGLKIAEKQDSVSDERPQRVRKDPRKP